MKLLGVIHVTHGAVTPVDSFQIKQKNAKNKNKFQMEMQLLVSLFTLRSSFLNATLLRMNLAVLLRRIWCSVEFIWFIWRIVSRSILDFCFLRVRLSECTFLLKSVRSSSMSLRRLRAFIRYIFASGVVHSGSLLRMSNRKPFLSYFCNLAIFASSIGLASGGGTHHGKSLTVPSVGQYPNRTKLTLT